MSGLLTQYLQVWNAATPAHDRLVTAERIFAPYGAYKEPMTEHLDPRGLVHHIETVALPQLGSFALRPAGAPQIHGRSLLFSWEYVGSDGQRGGFVGSSGTDFVQISEAGLLEQAIAFFDVALADGVQPSLSVTARSMGVPRFRPVHAARPKPMRRRANRPDRQRTTT